MASIQDMNSGSAFGIDVSFPKVRAVGPAPVVHLRKRLPSKPVPVRRAYGAGPLPGAVQGPAVPHIGPGPQHLLQRIPMASRLALQFPSTLPGHNAPGPHQSPNNDAMLGNIGIDGVFHMTQPDHAPGLMPGRFDGQGQGGGYGNSFLNDYALIHGAETNYGGNGYGQTGGYGAGEGAGGGGGVLGSTGGIS
jgi:hypothetical protein